MKRLFIYLFIGKRLCGTRLVFPSLGRQFVFNQLHWSALLAKGSKVDLERLPSKYKKRRLPKVDEDFPRTSTNFRNFVPRAFPLWNFPAPLTFIKEKAQGTSEIFERYRKEKEVFYSGLDHSWPFQTVAVIFINKKMIKFKAVSYTTKSSYPILLHEIH